MLDKESFQAYQKQWYGCSPEEANAKWKSALASPSYASCESGRGDAGRCEKPSEILHEYSISTEERTNAKMTAKQLFSCHSESQTVGAESSGLGTAALAKRGAVVRSIGVGSVASDIDDDGLRSRPLKKRAAGADRAYRALVLALPEPVDDGRASSG